MNKKILVIHGGAPTAVINSSLYGVVSEAKKLGFDSVLGAHGGAMGLVNEEFIQLDSIPEAKLRLLLQTPASAIGTSRDQLDYDHYEQMAAALKKHGIGYVLYNGGNGSMGACGKLKEVCENSGIVVVGIPKTIDNDIAVTDHAPGYGSAARYIATTVREVAADVQSLPIHVCIVEAMGRNTGWLTAASALSRDSGFGPHMLLFPERPFDEQEFLGEIQRLNKLHGGVVVVASEGLRYADGTPIVEPVFTVGRSVYYGDVSAHLAGLVIRKLGIKARSEKPGICGRASITCQSWVDRQEAEIAGREAVRVAAGGQSGIMIGFSRIAGKEYGVETMTIPIDQVMLHERTMPEEYISTSGTDVTDEFMQWCRPLIGDELSEFAIL